MKLLSIMLAAGAVQPAFSFDAASPGAPEGGDQPSVVPPLPLRPALNPDSDTDYGLDVSFPIHHDRLINPNSFQAKRYEHFMEGCYEKYSKGSCKGSEKSRIQLNIRQPKTQQNYTEIGFKHVKAPPGVYELLKKFFDDHQDKKQIEQWPTGNTYTNHWDSPTYMLSLESREFPEGRRIKSKVWDGVREMLEEWGGERLTPSSLYGVRIYTNGSILAPHVDRLPLVTSCIINVAQDINEPWPVEVYGRNGKATNVTMMPGDMVMYESHTTVHGRPTHLNGNYYANVFVHFEPIDENGHKKNEGSSETMIYPPPHHDANRFKRNLRSGNQENDGMKYYQHMEHIHSTELDQLTPEEVEEKQELEAAFATGSTSLHVAAAIGDLQAVKKFIHDGEDILMSDANSWQALHEAARGGHLEVVKELIEAGADLGATTFQGGTPLWWARQTLGNHHAVVKYLKSIGAPDLEAVGEL